MIANEKPRGRRSFRKNRFTIPRGEATLARRPRSSKSSKFRGVSVCTRTRTHARAHTHTRQHVSINDNVDRAAERVRLPTREHATRRAEHARFRNARRMPRAQLRRCSSTSGFQRTETASESGGSWLLPLLGKRQKVADFPNPNDGGEAGSVGKPEFGNP
jgi:hypothetical protein